MNPGLGTGEGGLEPGALGPNGAVVTATDRGNYGFVAMQRAMRNIDDDRPRGLLVNRKNTLTKH